jgi:hypothetical protein
MMTAFVRVMDTKISFKVGYPTSISQHINLPHKACIVRLYGDGRDVAHSFHEI